MGKCFGQELFQNQETEIISMPTSYKASVYLHIHEWLNYSLDMCIESVTVSTMNWLIEYIMFWLIHRQTAPSYSLFFCTVSVLYSYLHTPFTMDIQSHNNKILNKSFISKMVYYTNYTIKYSTEINI